MPKVVSIRPLSTFGDVAAEDDAVLDYFVSTTATQKVLEGEKFLVLGRKGSGKTALVRHFSEGKLFKITLALSLKGYPWSLHASRKDQGASDIEAYVSTWRYLISLQFAMLAYRLADSPKTKVGKSLAKYLVDNYGSVTPSFSDLLKPKKFTCSSASIEPVVLGCKLGSVKLDRKIGDLNLGTELNALTTELLNIAKDIIKTTRNDRIYVQIDELDQGLSVMDEDRSKMIIGLVLAVRDLHTYSVKNKAGFTSTIYLRTDMWDALSFSDKNKVSTTSTLFLDWDSDKLQEIIGARLAKKLGDAADWNAVTTEGNMRGSQTKWNHIVARTFMRPRDVIQFCNSALVIAKAREEEPLLLSNEDITSSRESYSAYLRNELNDEIMAHWQKWEEGLQVCSILGSVTFKRTEFLKEYASRKSKDNPMSGEMALELMYNYSIVGYERRSGYGGQSWVFRYQNPGAGWDNSAESFKVHLGLKEYAKLREERASTEV